MTDDVLSEAPSDAALDAGTLSALLASSHRIGRAVTVLAETGSTNDVAAHAGRAGEAAGPDGLVVFAERQTAGRGRLRRVWEAAPRRGLTFSILLRPAWAFAEWSRLTTWAAVGVARGLETAANAMEATRKTPIHAAIKWPNDIYLCGKKAVGILCECEPGRGEPTPQPGWAVVGIGVNVNQRPADFPPELREKATSLREAAGAAAPLDRHAVAAAILRELDALYDDLRRDFPGAFARIVAEAEQRSLLTGRRITLHTPQAPHLPAREGMALGLEPDGSLRVRFDDGTVEAVSGGEASVAGW